MNEKNIIYFDRAPQEHVDILNDATPQGFKVWCLENMDADEQKRVLAKADYFLILHHYTGRDTMEKSPQLKLVQRTGIGYNNVDIKAAEEMGIAVAIIPGGNGIAVAEHAILMTLALYRHLVELNLRTKAGKWPSFDFRLSSYELDGKTHGFIGFGFIGRETAKRSRAFGTKIIYYDPFRLPKETEDSLGAEYMSFEDVLRCSDVVSLHLPLNESTRNIITMQQLSMMKKDALLINCARGGLVDEDALYTVLKTGALGGAGIDCWVNEPAHEKKLFELDNVIASPHGAAGTIDTFRKCVRLSMANIEKAEREGKPEHVVNGVEKLRT